MADIICTVTREFAAALDRVSKGLDSAPLNRIAVFKIENAGLSYYRLMIGRGDKGATDLLDDEIMLDLEANRSTGPAVWNGIAERLIAKLALVEAGKDYAYSERAWKAETEGRFSPPTPLPPVKHHVIISPDVRFETVSPISETRDVVIVLIGPRGPCQVTNEKTGHTFVYDAEIKDGEALEVDVREQRVALKSMLPLSMATTDILRAVYDRFVRPDRELLNPNYAHLFNAWFALCEGTQTIRIDPLTIPLESASIEA